MYEFEKHYIWWNVLKLFDQLKLRWIVKKIKDSNNCDKTLSFIIELISLMLTGRISQKNGEIKLN